MNTIAKTNVRFAHCLVIALHQQVLEYLKKVNFTSKTGEQIFFDSRGDPAARYELVNWQPDDDGTLQFKSVGVYDTSAPSEQRFVLNQGGLTWAGGQSQV